MTVMAPGPKGAISWPRRIARLRIARLSANVGGCYLCLAFGVHVSHRCGRRPRKASDRGAREFSVHAEKRRLFPLWVATPTSALPFTPLASAFLKDTPHLL